MTQTILLIIMPSILFILGASIISAAAIVAGLYALSIIFEQGTDVFYDDKYNITHPEHITKPDSQWKSNAGDPIFIGGN